MLHSVSETVELQWCDATDRNKLKRCSLNVLIASRQCASEPGVRASMESGKIKSGGNPLFVQADATGQRSNRA